MVQTFRNTDSTRIYNNILKSPPERQKMAFAFLAKLYGATHFCTGVHKKAWFLHYPPDLFKNA